MRIRVPLQVGTAAVRSLVVAVLCIVPGFAALFASPAISDALAPKRTSMFNPTPTSDPAVGSFIFFCTMIAGGIVVTIGAGQLRRGQRRRPSDLVIAADGIAFEGGPHDGFSLDWRDVGAPWTLDVKGAVTKLVSISGSDGADPANRAARDEAFLIAETSDSDEALAFAETNDAITALARPPGAIADPSAGTQASRARLFECASCGAPLVAVDADAATCAFCKHVNVVPADFRDRARAALQRRSADSATDRAVSALLAQSSAKSATTTLNLSASVMLASWLLALGVVFVRYYRETITSSQVAALVTLPSAVVCGVACVAIAVVSNRRALHIVTLALGAIAPKNASDVWACRRCGGPLAAGAGIVACPHCGAHNIVGVDLSAARDVDDAAIESALATRRARRHQSVAIGGLGAAILVISLVCARSFL